MKNNILFLSTTIENLRISCNSQKEIIENYIHLNLQISGRALINMTCPDDVYMVGTIFDGLTWSIGPPFAHRDACLSLVNSTHILGAGGNNNLKGIIHFFIEIPNIQM